MIIEEFRLFVSQNEVWFRGVLPETAASIAEAERQLKHLIPPTMSYLLVKHGYSGACGIGALEYAVKVTIEARLNLPLPERYIILNDQGDAGFVFFDAATRRTDGECRIYWAGAHNLSALVAGQSMDSDVDVFEDYPAWVLFCLEQEKAEAEAIADEARRAEEG